MITVDTNPEFGIELVLSVPYAYWLHKKGKLEKVITSKGMKPFYYFCDNVEEKYEYRTIDNKAANMDSLPNNWIYGSKNNAKLYKNEWKNWESFSKVDRGCGILDYNEWKIPDYSAYYKNDEIKFNKPIIVLSNRYNWEHGGEPVCYFDIECLCEMFSYFTNKGYVVVYKRPKNTEFPLDQNEINTLRGGNDLIADVSGIGYITDYQLTEYFDDVYLIDDIVKNYPQYTYNEVQLKLFSNTSYFVGMGGGSTLLLCLFKKPTIAYYGRKMVESNRENFWEDKYGNKNIKNYHFMLNPNLKPFIDAEGEDMVHNNYKDFIKFLKGIIK